MPDICSVGTARLRRTLAAVAAAHPFYRTRFRELGLAAGDIRSLDDLQALPLTRKEDYISDPEAFRLRPEDLRDVPSRRRGDTVRRKTGTEVAIEQDPVRARRLAGRAGRGHGTRGEKGDERREDRDEEEGAASSVRSGGHAYAWLSIWARCSRPLKST